MLIPVRTPKEILPVNFNNNFSNEFTFISKKGEPDTTEYIGMELEFPIVLNTNGLREIAEKLIGLGYMEKGTISVLYVARTIRKIFEESSYLLYNTCLDGGGVELSFHPMTLKAIHACSGEFSGILTYIKEFGMGEAGGAGIHYNINMDMLGPVDSSKKRTLAKFLWFLYNNPEFIVEFSNRRYNDSHLADMYYMLGDLFKNLHPSDRETAFLGAKETLLDSISSGNSVRSLNIVSNKRNRKAIEFRWFGSTTNLDTLYSQVEFMFAIIEFAKSFTIEEMSLVPFIEFIKGKDRYLNLFVRLHHIDVCRKIINSMYKAKEFF